MKEPKKPKPSPRVFEAETLALPPLSMVLTDVPAPEPKPRMSPHSELQERLKRSETILRLIEFFATQP